jgi:hypothetical protein
MRSTRCSLAAALGCCLRSYSQPQPRLPLITGPLPPAEEVELLPGEECGGVRVIRRQRVAGEQVLLAGVEKQQRPWPGQLAQERRRRLRRRTTGRRSSHAPAAAPVEPRGTELRHRDTGVERSDPRASGRSPDLACSAIGILHIH